MFENLNEYSRANVVNNTFRLNYDKLAIIAFDSSTRMNFLFVFFYFRNAYDWQQFDVNRPFFLSLPN